ncbi:MAG TPA: cadherin-like domain-containing protein, partial [Azospirillaceae bacterium]|nr:cadherin-like domain-containing protein [Azospirillaceae bacterium]
MASDKGNNHNSRGSQSDEDRKFDRDDNRGRDGDNDGRGHESHGNGLGVGHHDHGNGHGYGHDEDGHGGGGGASPAPEPEEISLAVANKNVNATRVAADWAAQGVTVRAATGLVDNPATWSDAPLGTKNVAFSLSSKNTTDSSLFGRHEYSGLGVAAKNGIDRGEIDSMGGAGGVSELMAVSFAKPMAEVTIELSALFDGHEDRSTPGADAGPYDRGYVEKAMLVVFNPEGEVVGRVEVSGTVVGLASVTLDADNFGGEIGSVAIVPVSNGAGRSGNNSDFLLRSVSGVVAPQDNLAATPSLSADDVAGAEDSAIALDVSAALSDLDGSESLSVTISGVPAGATLSAGVDNGDGTWTLSADDLAGLTLTPPQDFAGAINLSVTAKSVESNGGATATRTASFTVEVAAVADAPTLSVLDASGLEDGVIALDVSAALSGVSDTETLSVTIAGVPAGAALSAGTDNGDGTWTLTSAQLNDLSLTPPANFGGEIELSITATATESNGSTATQSAALTVTVEAVADTPTLTGAAVETVSLTTPNGGVNPAAVTAAWAAQGVTVRAAVGDADNPSTWTDAPLGTKNVSFSLSSQNTGDASQWGSYAYSGLAVNASGNIDGGEIDIINAGNDALDEVMALSFDKPMETVTLELSALFDGHNDPAVAGPDQGPYDGGYVEKARVTVFGVDGQVLGHADVAGTINGLASVTLNAADFGGLIGSVAMKPLDDGAGRSGNNSDFLLRSVTATTAAELPDAAGLEDGAIALDVSAALGDLDGSESLSVTIAGVPAGATLSAGVDNGDGTWTLESGDLAGLTLTPPQDFAGAINLSVTATATDANGDTATQT